MTADVVAFLIQGEPVAMLQKMRTGHTCDAGANDRYGLHAIAANWASS
jgi:hypothetical protein